ncbi:MAG: hypothetical protein EB127_06430, partial [Alphaproteobacteria bacterium]|nr:hypothetical protein [Alphaproteobacteria bacterium]
VCFISLILTYITKVVTETTGAIIILTSILGIPGRKHGIHQCILLVHLVDKLLYVSYIYSREGVPPIPWYSGFNFFDDLARWVLYIQFNFQRGPLYSIQFPEGPLYSIQFPEGGLYIQFNFQRKMAQFWPKIEYPLDSISRGKWLNFGLKLNTP